MAQGVSAVLSNQFVYCNGQWNLFSGPIILVCFFAGISPRKQQLEIRALIIQSADRYILHADSSIWLCSGIPDFSAVCTSTLSVKNLNKKNYFVAYPTNWIIFPKIESLIKGTKLVLHHL
jgi:hypothetical protein